MKLFAWRFVALSSTLLFAAVAATRPRYGGTLRIQVLELPAIEASSLTADTLIRIDEHGDLQPGLAVSWQHDAGSKRWRFNLRSKVSMHDGTPLNASFIAVALSSALQLQVTASGQQIIVQNNDPAPDLLPRIAMLNASIPGTGPFRILEIEPGHGAALAAFEDYWGGRPYVDRVEFSLAKERSGTVDATEIPVNISRRMLGERPHLWTSQPREAIALTMPGVPSAVREAIAFSIDRDAVANVITQRRGEAARGLLPQWLSGYSFLFPSERDLARARALAAASKTTLTLSVPANDSLLRMIADRIAVNARDAGITISVLPQPSTALLRIVRLHLASNDAAMSLLEYAHDMGLADRLTGIPLNSPQALFEAERSLLSDYTIVPIVHVPSVYALDARVHNWDAAHLENVWMEP
jgi:ABC-type transport system substrate-binding protein